MAWAACCLAAATFTTAVSADVAVTIRAEGYDDFFKRCKLDIGMQRSDNITESMIVYRIAAGDKGALMCTKEDYSSGCNGELENYTCEDVTGIDVYGAVCLDGNGARTDCGKVTAKKGGGLSAPVRMLPDPPAADTVVFGSLSGYDDFFDRCDMAFMYTSDPSVRRVDLELEVTHSGGKAECSWNFSAQGSSGSSCLGKDDFSCDAVSQITVKTVSCHANDEEVDCGSVAFSSAESGLLVDGR
jgi:hypothetical protein